MTVSGIRVAMVLALASASIAGLAAPARSANPTERNRATITAFADLFYQQRNVQKAFTTFVAPGYIQHNPSIGDGRDAAIPFLQKLFSAPGARFEVKRIVVDGDIAVVHLRGQPDPSQPAVAVADIYRLENGMIVEHWDVVQPIPPQTPNPRAFF